MIRRERPADRGVMMEAVLFDIGDTLIRFDRSNPRQLVATAVRASHDSLVERGYRAPPFDVYDRAIYVGDNLRHDVSGASRVGMKTVWLTPNDAPPVHRTRPDYVIRELSELLPILQVDQRHAR